MLYHIVMAPWHILPDIGGDGAKNNFTYIYHAMFDKGFWFDGMNYPYGEHIVYTDGQPLLSVLFTHFSNVTPEKALAVLWLLVGLSYVLSMVYTYLTLVHFKVGRLAALLFAGLIGVLTPQIIRLQGHYALSYVCLVPMLFYWTVHYHERSKLKYCAYVFIIGCLMSFLHPYFAAVILVWVMCYTLGYFVVIHEGFAKKILHTAPLIGSIVGVLLVVAVVMKLTDPITDRPGAPLMGFDSATHLKDLLTTVKSPLWRMAVHNKWIPSASEGAEGYCYPGLVVFFTMFFVFLAMARKRLRKKKHAYETEQRSIPVIWLFVAIAALLFSMGAPFVWHMEWMLKYLSFFKQFRSLGRFSWIFYYVITVYTAVVLYDAYTRFTARGMLLAGYSVLLVPMALWSYEASGYINYSRKLSESACYGYDMIFSVHEQNWESFLKEHQHKGSDFQAVLMLPLFHIGTEKLWVGDPGWLMTLGTKACLQLHLPMVNVMMSRSSWSQAEKQVKIAAGPFVQKPLLSDIKSDKPFLLLRTDYDSLDADQKYLLESADYLGHYSQCYIYACYPARIAASDKRYADSVASIARAMHGTDTCLNCTGTSYTAHFDTEQAGVAPFFGKGAAPCIVHDDSTIAMIPVQPARDSELYEFSVWFLLGNKDYRSPYVRVESLDSAGQVIASADAITRQSVDNEGMWFRARSYFPMRRECRTIRCVLINIENPAYIAMDELQLRPAAAMIIYKSPDGRLLVNNHLYKGK